MADADDEVVEEETFPYHTWYSSHSEDEKREKSRKFRILAGKIFGDRLSTTYSCNNVYDSNANFCAALSEWKKRFFFSFWKSGEHLFSLCRKLTIGCAPPPLSPSFLWTLWELWSVDDDNAFAHSCTLISRSIYVGSVVIVVWIAKNLALDLESLERFCFKIFWHFLHWNTIYKSFFLVILKKKLVEDTNISRFQHILCLKLYKKQSFPSRECQTCKRLNFLISFYSLLLFMLRRPLGRVQFPRQREENEVANWLPSAQEQTQKSSSTDGGGGVCLLSSLFPSGVT